MKLEFGYGSGVQTVEVPEENLLAVLESNPKEHLRRGEEAVRYALANPIHPYTKALLSAIPVPDLDHKTERILLKGEISSPINPKDECRFKKRCFAACEKCECSAPQLVEVSPKHFVACHLACGE